MLHIFSNLNPLTEWAIAFISLVGIFFQITWSRRGIALGPTLLTTLGIFFCFTGIALGLADFDPNDVKASVPHLLQGIRTSFWVSVSGIGWALTIKIRYVMFGDAVSSVPAGTATVDDLATQLIELNGQASAARNDSNDRLERLITALANHTEFTAEANSKALIQALSGIVRDFNAKLNEQFGENFKELNVGVGRLVTWQIQYEQQLNGLIERENTLSNSMSVVSERYAELVDRSSAFVGTAESLRSLLTTLNGERESLADGLTVLAGLVKNASTGLPMIERTIVEMTNQISRGVQTNQEMLGSVLKSSWQSIQVHNQHLTAILAKSLESANREAASYTQQVA